MIAFSRRRGRIRGWNEERASACSDVDVVVFVCRVVCTVSCGVEGEDGSTKDTYVDLSGDLNEDVSLPVVCVDVDQVADGEGDVSRVVHFVLFENDVAPGLVEISACHDKAARVWYWQRDAEEVFIFFFHLLVLPAALFLVTVLNVRKVGF
jgi:hypothetical protein